MLERDAAQGKWVNVVSDVEGILRAKYVNTPDRLRDFGCLYFNKRALTRAPNCLITRIIKRIKITCKLILKMSGTLDLLIV